MNIKHILLIILSLYVVTTYCQSNVIKFGASVHSLSEHYFDLLFTPSIVSSYKFFEYWINNNVEINIDGDDYSIKFIIYEDDRTGIEDNYIKLADEDECHVLFSDGSIMAGEISAEIANERKLPLLVTSPQPNVYKNRTSVFNVYPNPYSQLKDILPSLRVSGIKSIHVLDMSNSTKACYDIEEIFEENSITDITKTIYSQYGTEFEEAIDKVIELDKDLLMYCNMNQTNYNELTRILSERKYMPRAGLNLMLDKFDLNDTYSDYWLMFQVPIKGLKQPKTKYFGDFEDIRKDMEEFFKLYPQYEVSIDEWEENIVMILSKLELALDAIIVSNSLDRNDIVDAIRRAKFDSFIGKISFASDNTHLISGVAYQQINDTVKNILLPSVLSNASIIYPAPQFDERVRDDSLRNIEIIVYVFIGIGMINSIFWILYVIINRKTKIIHSSSPIFLIGMLIGSVVIYGSVITLSPSLNNTATCFAVYWLLSIGFILLFGSMLVKTWRIHVIFSTKTFQVFQVPNKTVLLFLSLLVAIDAILLILWSTLSKVKSIELIVDEHRLNQNYNTCTSNVVGTVFTWIIVGYKGLLIGYGAYLALRIRTVPMKIYDESKVIAFCIYNIGLSAIIITILQATSPTGRYAVFGINSFLIIISVASTINSMLISKLEYIQKMRKSTGSSTNSSGMSTMNSTTSNNNQMSTFDTITDLKKKLNKSDKEYAALKRKFKQVKDENKKLLNIIKSKDQKEDTNDQSASNQQSSSEQES